VEVKIMVVAVAVVVVDQISAIDFICNNI